MEVVGPTRDELRVPGEEENGEYAEKDENSLFRKPMAQICRHRMTWARVDGGSERPQAGVTGPRLCFGETRK